MQTALRVAAAIDRLTATTAHVARWGLLLNALLIAGSEGVQYSVRDMTALDRASRRLLERFL